MLNMNITSPTVSVTANADLRRVAVPSNSEFSLNSLLDGGRTVRSNAVAGSISIGHQSSKELGGSTRHLVRRDRAQNGDLCPASAQLVIVAQDTAAGRVAAREAVLELIASLITFQGLSPVTPSDDAFSVAITNGELTLLTENGNPANLPSLNVVLDRILNGEG